MRLVVLTLGLSLASTGCQNRVPIGSSRAIAPRPASGVVEPEPDQVENYPSPNGRAALVYVDTPRLDRVVLAARGDSAEVYSWEGSKRLGVEWLSADLGRVWVPFGTYTYQAVYAEASSARISPPLEFAVAVDPDAETVVTFDSEAVTLRSLWSGEALATWVPDGPDLLDLLDLRHTCEPSFSLVGRSAAMRYDCGDGAQEQKAAWHPPP